MHKEFTDNVKVKNESINCKEVMLKFNRKCHDLHLDILERPNINKYMFKLV